MNAKPHFYDELRAVFKRKQKKKQNSVWRESTKCNVWQLTATICYIIDDISLSPRHFCFVFSWAPEIGRVT